MMAKLRKKLKSQAGETLGETLAALLIAAFALVMLAGAVSAGSNVIFKGREKLKEYYSANEAVAGVVKMKSGGASGTITITDATAKISDQSYQVTYYKNDKFVNRTVVAYEYSPAPAGGGGGG